jgi:SHS2 domain-containing protein
VPYRYLEDLATADVAFEAWGNTAEELFVAAAQATMNVMVRDLSTIAARQKKPIRVTDEALDLLLFQLLQELIFYKDAERLLLVVERVRIGKTEGEYELTCEAAGEEIDPARHDLIVDVKAVTLHKFKVEETARGWEALVILDI